jgi:hypothetical protein
VRDFDSKMTVYEEEQKILRTQNQELQQELEALKVRAAYIHQVC